jgi:glycolate oxidase iron-sulfur subunit
VQTNFTLAQLADPDTAQSEKILRACVHCGFCTATCPTYVLTGDELDGPRGRIYLIKDMFEGGRAASATVVKHIDRCLSCLACMTTCPSGVHYMHLVDHARKHIAETFRRPAGDRFLRKLLAVLLPRPALFRSAAPGPSCAALRPVDAGAPRRDDQACPGGTARAFARRPAPGLPGRRGKTQARGAAQRLRPNGAASGDQ